MKLRFTLISLILLLALLLGLASRPRPVTAAPAPAGPVDNDASYRSDVCYQIVTDRFFDGNPANNNPPQSPGLYDASRANWKLYWGGDWAGITQQLPYLQNLGITAIWISPPVDNINRPAYYGGAPNAGYHGYWARDFKTPEEHFGTMTEFRALVSAAHARGIKVVVDWAPNHSSPADASDPSFAEDGALYNAGAFLASYSNDPNGFFHHAGGVTNWDDRYETQYLNLFDLADLEQTNPAVNRYLQAALAVWLRTGVDGLRMDAVKHMTFGWQRATNDAILSRKPLFIFGEWYLGGPADPLYADSVRFANDSGTALLDFVLNDAIRDVFGSGQPMALLDGVLAQTAVDYAYPGNLVTFIDNHDMPRFLTLNGDPARLHQALTFLLTVRGLPCLYYGTEQYLHNDTAGGGDPYNRPMMPGFDENTTAFQLVDRLSALRQAQPALQFGDHQQRWISDDVYIYERQFHDDVVLVAINRSSSWQTISGLTTALPPGTYADELGGLLGGHALTVGSGSGGDNPVATWQLGPNRAMVWSYNAAPPPAPQLGSVAPTLTRAGSLLTLEGQGFGAQTGSSAVLIGPPGAQQPAAIQSWTDGRIVAAVPAAAPAGRQSLQVVTGGGSSAAIPVEVLSGQQVPVTFRVNSAFTNLGDQVYLTGSVPELSNWSTATTGGNKPVSGGALGPAVTHGGLYPSWLLTVSLPCATTVQFKFVKVSPVGVVTWEGGANHSYTTPACGLVPAPGSVAVSWQN